MRTRLHVLNSINGEYFRWTCDCCTSHEYNLQTSNKIRASYHNLRCSLRFNFVNFGKKIIVGYVKAILSPLQTFIKYSFVVYIHHFLGQNLRYVIWFTFGTPYFWMVQYRSYSSAFISLHINFCCGWRCWASHGNTISLLVKLRIKSVPSSC